jgi:hypothetical protein
MSTTTPPEQNRITQTQMKQESEILDRVFPSAIMMSFQPMTLISKAGFFQYLEDQLMKSGNPQDPIQRRMTIQFFVNDMRLLYLQSQAAQATGENAKILNSAAARLLGEVRRLGESLQTQKKHRKKKISKLKVFRSNSESKKTKKAS